MSKTALIIAGVAVAGVALYVMSKRKPGETMGGTAGRVLVDTASDAGVGVVKAIGAQVGIPDTNLSQCEKDLAAGDYWAASFSCPAGKFVSGVYGSTTINHAAIGDARQIDRIMERQAANQPVVQPHGADYDTPGLPAYFGA